VPQGYDDDGDGPPVCPSNEITQIMGMGLLTTVWCGDTTANLEPAAVAAIAVTPFFIIAAAAGVAL
jgi:hypothetical protein